MPLLVELKDMGGNRIPENYEQPTQHERLRSFVEDLEDRIDKGGNNSPACKQVPENLELELHDAPKDVKNIVKRIRIKCKYNRLIAFLLLNYKVLITACILLTGISIVVSHSGSGSSPQNPSETIR